MERMKDTLTLAGAAETSDALLADVERNATYLQRCANEAEAVLHGDLDAATRLWLLLRQPINAGPTIPSSILIHVAGDAWRGPPRAIDGIIARGRGRGSAPRTSHPNRRDARRVARLLQPLSISDRRGQRGLPAKVFAKRRDIRHAVGFNARPVDPAVLQIRLWSTR
jgi:hypothetical protein